MRGFSTPKAPVVIHNGGWKDAKTQILCLTNISNYTRGLRVFFFCVVFCGHREKIL